jgi:ABC-type multidrug transport system fused ATPase/permease subunit
LLNGTKLFLKSFNVYQKETTSYGLRVALLSNVSKPVAELFIVLILCFVIIFAKHFSFEFGVGNISIMLTSLILIQRISQAMASINSNYMGMMAALPSFDALEALYLEHEKSLIERTSEGKINIRAFNNKIQFEDVTFSYKKDSIVLDKLNLTFKRGEKSAIVGASGCGKSTTVDLITGLIVPPKGSITVDGIDLTTVNIQDWRQRIGFVSQDIFIFHDTVENNILFGRLDATMDEVIRAAKLANAHDFVTKLEKGYKTDIGEKGLRLSAGQRQRIGIARALIRNPEILIFDEATSALDTVSEKQVQEAIDKVSEFTTVISIAHRLSTIKNYDKIYVMEHGKVLEEGSHEELVSLNGAYSKLSSLQHT